MITSIKNRFALPIYAACLSLGLFSFEAIAATCRYTVDNEWDTGFTATVSISNTGAAAINGWSVNWRYNLNRVESFWSATISGGNPYAAANLTYNATIQPGTSVSFGLKGLKNGGKAEVPQVGGGVCGGIIVASPSSTSSVARSSVRSSTVLSSVKTSTAPSSIKSSTAFSSVRSSTPLSSVKSSTALSSVKSSTALSSVKSSTALSSVKSSTALSSAAPSGFQTKVDLPARIEAENYQSAFDTTAGNINPGVITGCTYYGLNVDVQNSSQGGCAVGWTDATETLQYAIGNAGGSYDLALSVSSVTAGKRIRVLDDGKLLGTVTTHGGGWLNWELLSIKGVTISTNTRLTVEFVDGDGNLDYIQVNNAPKDNLTLLSRAVELSRSMVDTKSYSALGQQDDPAHPFAGAMGGQIVSYRDFQYVVYYQSTGAVTIARRDLTAPTINWQKSVLQGYTVRTDDRHNKMAIAISEGDGVIHIAFDHHVSPSLHYASTAVGAALNPRTTAWTNSTFTYKENLNQDSAFSGTFAASTVTYPSLTKIGDGVMLAWRSGGQGQGRTNLAFYDTRTQQWTIRRAITSENGTFTEGSYTSTSRGPYTVGFHLDAQNNLHLAWLWREQSGTIPGVTYRNHGLYYAWSKDGGATWLDTTGRKIGDGTSMSIDNTKPVWDIPMKLDPQNSNIGARLVPETQEFEVYVSQERSLTDATRVNYIYRRAVNGTWTRHEGAQTPGGIGVPLPAGAPVGPAQAWDYSRLYSTGIVSVVAQAEPNTPGLPTPLVVVDYRFAQ